MGRRIQMAAALASLLLAACGITERRVQEHGAGSGGSGGAASGYGAAATGGKSATGGSALANAATAGASSAETTVTIVVKGLPPAVAPLFSVTFAEDAKRQPAFDHPGTYAGVLPGQYLVRTAPLFDGGATVRTLITCAQDDSTFELSEGETHTLELDYSPVPASGKLWRSSDDHASAIGFPSARLEPVFGPVPPVVVPAAVGHALAFDQQGNLWTLAPSTATAQLLRYGATAFNGDSPEEPEISIDLAFPECQREAHDLAFDTAGGLWLTVCHDRLCKLEPESLLTSGRKPCDQVLPGPLGGDRLAFDQHGDLHITAGTTIEQIPRQTVANPTFDEPHSQLTVLSPDGNVLEAHAIAFDREGNLWGVDATSNSLFAVEVEDFGKTRAAPLVFARFRPALSGDLAFDDSGGLWLALAGGQVAHLRDEELSRLPGPPELAEPMTFDLIDTVGPLVFFPAPSGLPLHSSVDAQPLP